MCEIHVERVDRLLTVPSRILDRSLNPEALSNRQAVCEPSRPIALYLAAAAVVTLIAALFMRETKGIDLATVDQADRDDLAKAGVA